MSDASPSLFQGIIGHRLVRQVLLNAVEHPVGAYLLYGPQGVGKGLLAERFAHALLGLSPEATLESHPDFVRLTREAEAREITVKQVRELLARLHLSSAYGGRRVALIEQADRLNEEACNALLKDVEEPGAGVTFLFLAEQMDRLPGTLRSRLVPLRCDRVPHLELSQWLQANQGCSPEEAVNLARKSDGIPGRAVAMRTGQEEGPTAIAKNLVKGLLLQDAGQVIASLDQFTKSIEKGDDTEAAWRSLIQVIGQLLQSEWPSQPVAAIRVGRAAAHVWRLIGSSVPPRLGFEWNVLAEPFAKQQRVAALLENDAA